MYRQKLANVKDKPKITLVQTAVNHLDMYGRDARIVAHSE